MKVVHVIAKDVGGAARAAIRINQALQSVGISSSILVLRKSVENSSIKEVFTNKFSWNAFRLLRKINNVRVYRYGLRSVFYEARYGIDITGNRMIQEADVVNLHWVNDGMLSNRTLKRLLKSGKKIVWTLHDMYAFTGGCYYDEDCKGIDEECRNCPLANGNVRIEKFIAKQFQSKNSIYPADRMKLVGCSHWMSEKAQNSPLTRKIGIVTIPNPIDINIFKPMETDKIPNIFWNPSKKIILFGAMSADSNKRKGYQYLKEALSLLEPSKYQAIVFGNKQSVEKSIEGIDIIGVGRIDEDSQLAQLYSIADVFVAPSKQENLSNAVMEALACGTPVVAFRIGGMEDMIEHKVNGYLAEPFEAVSLAKGIEYSVNHDLKENCCATVRKKFSMNKVGKQYMDLYQSI